MAAAQKTEPVDEKWETPKKRINVIDKVAQAYEQQVIIRNVKNAGIKVEVYFDTYYILRLIQGFWELRINKVKDIDARIFRNDLFLVKSLAYFGYVEGIKILLPHAAELRNQMQKTFLLPDAPPDIKDIQKFLNTIGLPELEKLSAEDKRGHLLSYLENLRLKTEDIFKANYVLIDLLWENRFRHLFFNGDNSIIQFDDKKYDKIKILDSDLFLKIDGILNSDGKRKEKTVNNLRDAMALCIIHEKIKEYKNGGALPIFYLSEGVMKKLSGIIRDEFMVQGPSGEPISVLKSTPYFVLEAMFSAVNNKPAEEDVLSKMIRIKESVVIYRNIKGAAPEADILQIDNDWNRYRKNDFFEKLWKAEHGSRKLLSENIKRLFKYDLLIYNNDDIKKMVDEERVRLRASLDGTISDLVFLEEIWNEINTIPAELRRLVNKKSPLLEHHIPDVFTVEALTRFSPPRGEVESDIRMYWSEFLETYSRNDERLRRVKVKLTESIYDHYSLRGKQDYQKIMASVAILFVFHKYQLIVNIFEKLGGKFGNFSNVYIYLASLIKLDHKTDDYHRKVQKFMRFAENAKWNQENFESWMAMGYCKFNYWATQTEGEFKYENPRGSRQYGEFDKFAKQAISITKKAYFEIKKELQTQAGKKQEEAYLRVKYYYCLNNYVYYVICGGTWEEFESSGFTKMAKELEALQEGESPYKQPRFFDTVASYYHRKSKDCNTTKEQRKLLLVADGFSEKALKWTVLDEGKFQALRRKIFMDIVEVGKKIKAENAIKAEYRQSKKEALTASKPSGKRKH